MAAATLHTIGYSGFTPDTFVAQLKSAGIDVLIDVRRNPVSRKKGFSKSKLSEFLRDRGIDYVHLPELGVPDELRDELREGIERGEYLYQFSRYLAGCDDALDDLLQRSLEQRCCLMCLEKNPAECHRSVVAEELRARANGQLRVQHLSVEMPKPDWTMD